MSERPQKLDVARPSILSIAYFASAHKIQLEQLQKLVELLYPVRPAGLNHILMHLEGCRDAGLTQAEIQRELATAYAEARAMHAFASGPAIENVQTEITEAIDEHLPETPEGRQS